MDRLDFGYCFQCGWWNGDGRENPGADCRWGICRRYAERGITKRTHGLTERCSDGERLTKLEKFAKGVYG